MLCVMVNRTNAPGDKFIALYSNSQAAPCIFHCSLCHTTKSKGNWKTNKEK